MKILAVTVTPSILTRRLFQIWKLSGRGKAAIGSEDDLKYTGFQAHKMPGSLFCQCLTWGFELWDRWTESENGLWESHSETAEEKVRRDGSGMDWAEIKVGNPHNLGFIHNLETSNWMSCTTQRAATTPVQHIDYLWPCQAPPCWLYMIIVSLGAIASIVQHCPSCGVIKLLEIAFQIIKQVEWSPWVAQQDGVTHEVSKYTAILFYGWNVKIPKRQRGHNWLTEIVPVDESCNLETKLHSSINWVWVWLCSAQCALCSLTNHWFCFCFLHIWKAQWHVCCHPRLAWVIQLIYSTCQVERTSAMLCRVLWYRIWSSIGWKKTKGCYN